MEKLPSSSTNAQMRVRSEGSDSGRRSTAHFHSTFSDLLDPFGPTWSLSQVLNHMDQASARVSPVGRRDWDAREDENAFYLRIDMPGLDMEHVRVSVEQDTLVIKGEGEKEHEDESLCGYNTRIDFSSEYFFMDEIRTEMKNGVLKVVVPKIKEEDLNEVSGDDFVSYKRGNASKMLWRLKQPRVESLRSYIRRFNTTMG